MYASHQGIKKKKKKENEKRQKNKKIKRKRKVLLLPPLCELTQLLNDHSMLFYMAWKLGSSCFRFLDVETRLKVQKRRSYHLLCLFLAHQTTTSSATSQN